MASLPFAKYHGAGNDFIMVDERDHSFQLSEETIRILCDRHLGIGADGLIIVRKEEDFDFRMIYYNSDGREGSMCGDGGRCVTAFVYHLDGKTSRHFTAIDGTHRGYILNPEAKNPLMVHVSLNDVTEWDILDSNNCSLNTGSPHHVRLVPDVSQLDVLNAGKAIRYSDFYKPDGVNANFLEIRNGELHCRTYERGVENETLSCGTGATAAAISANLLLGLEAPLKIIALGGELEVDFKRSDSGFHHITLTGPAMRVFEGTVHI